MQAEVMQAWSTDGNSKRKWAQLSDDLKLAKLRTTIVKSSVHGLQGEDRQIAYWLLLLVGIWYNPYIMYSLIPYQQPVRLGECWWVAQVRTFYTLLRKIIPDYRRNVRPIVIQWFRHLMSSGFG